MSDRHSPRLLAAVALAAAALSARADIPIYPIVRTGDPIPGEIPSFSTQFTFFGVPSININGTVAFRSQANHFGVFIGTPTGYIRRVAVGSDPAPGLPDGGTFALFDENIPINARGAVAFTSVFSGPASGGGADGAWSNPGGQFQSIILPGDPLVGHPAGGTFSSFGTNFNPVVLADNGVTAYNAWTSTFPGVGRWGIWAGQTKAGTVKVALNGDSAPTLGADTFFDRIDAPVINPTGVVAFHATVNGPATNFNNRDLIWAGLPGDVKPVVRSDAIAPGTAYKFSTFNQPDISSTGKVAFRASLDINAPFGQRNGIWAGTPGDLTLVARAGQPAPGAGGATFSSTFQDPLVNAGGVVSFAASLAGAGVSATTNGTGLWTGPDAAHLTLVARVGDHAPGADAGVNFAWPSDFDHVLNNLGQVAFLASLTGPGVDYSNDNGIWVYDPLKGTRLVAREGQTLDVLPGVTRTISSLDLRVGASAGDGRATSLGNNGQLAFTAGFTSGIDYAVLVADIGGITPGDANRDGIVDVADLKNVLAHMDAPGGFASGDFNGDGMVNFADYQMLESNYGKRSPDFVAPEFAVAPTFATDAVPEPAASGLAAFAAVATLARRRCRRTRSRS